MILYVDTSALVKRYIDEEGRELALAALGAASLVTTSAITYAEARAAFARRWRAGDLDEEQLAQLISRLDTDWSVLNHMDTTNSVAQHAGKLAQAYGLRGFDAVHLASALAFTEQFENLNFLAFDNRLTDAARAASLIVYGDSPDSGRNGER